MEMKGHGGNGSAIALAAALLTMLSAAGAAMAANPGHTAAAIGPGIFESGNYTFPEWLRVNGSIYVNGSINVSGISMGGPSYFTFGPGTVASGDLSFAAGYRARAIGAGSIAIGNMSRALAFNSLAIGSRAFVADSADYGVAIGNNASVFGVNSTAIGPVKVFHDNEVGIGGDLNVSGDISLTGSVQGNLNVTGNITSHDGYFRSMDGNNLVIDSRQGSGSVIIQLG